MADVIMPQMGESIAEGTVTRWLKNVGDAVERDEPLFEISTDKVDAEIPSPAAGVLREIRVPPGTTVPINSVVGVIGEASEETAEPGSDAPAAAASAETPTAAAGAAVAGAPPAASPAPTAEPVAPSAATPAASPARDAPPTTTPLHVAPPAVSTSGGIRQ